MKQRIPFHRRIAFRLIVFFGALALAGTLAAGYVSIRLAEREFFNVMQRQFNSTSRLAENSLDIIGQMAKGWAFHFASDNVLSRQLRGNNRADVLHAVESMRESAHCDTLIVLDERGHIIQHSAFPEKNGDSLLSWQLVRRAVNDKRSGYAIVEESGNFIIYGSGMAESGKQGANPIIVLTGFRISDELVASLSQGTGIGLTFVRRSAVMASSFNTEQAKMVNVPVSYFDYQMLYGDPHLTKVVKIAGQELFASVRQLHMLEPSMDGSLFLTYPSSQLLAISERLQREYLWLYSAGMLLLVLFIWKLSHRLMRPLHQLSERMQLIAVGDLTHVSIGSNDEIGSIASSFNDLLEELAGSKQKVERHAEELELLVGQRTQELRTANEELTRQATHDVLTGFPNRKLFHDRLHQAIALAHRTNFGMALLFIDLDRFKWVNDTFGHAVGDELLKAAANRIQSCLRDGDTVARLGGDEFTVILSQVGTRNNLQEVSERLLMELCRPFDLTGAANTRISASIGVAVYPEHGVNEEELLLHADHAMYAAKSAGKATYRFWQPAD